MINAIIEYLENLKYKLTGKESYKTTLTKREQCVNLIKKMARQMNMPKDAMEVLNSLDLSIATDEQVDALLPHLTGLIETVERENKRLGVNIIKEAAKTLKHQ